MAITVRKRSFEIEYSSISPIYRDLKKKCNVQYLGLQGCVSSMGMWGISRGTTLY
jgi:hypothetical protein